jgi:hypothetical protein
MTQGYLAQFIRFLRDTLLYGDLANNKGISAPANREKRFVLKF